jgi:hypothetical protein
LPGERKGEAIDKVAKMNGTVVDQNLPSSALASMNTPHHKSGKVRPRPRVLSGLLYHPSAQAVGVNNTLEILA